MRKIAVTFCLCLVVTTTVFSEDSMVVRCENISIEAPLGWLVQYTKSPNLLFMYSPLENNDSFQENMNIAVEILPTEYSIFEYMNASLETIKSIYSNLEIIERLSNYYVISGIVSGTSVQQIQYFFIKDKVAYILTFSSNPQNFERYRKDFLYIANTFKIEEG